MSSSGSTWTRLTCSFVRQVKFFSMSAPLSFKDARGAGVANGTSNSAQEETPLSRLNAKPFHLFTSSEAFLYLSSNNQSLVKFEMSWCLSGIQLLEFYPSVFVQNIQRKIPTLPYSIAVSMFIAIQKKVASDTEKFKEVINIQVAEEWARAHDYVVVDHFVAENSTIDLTMLDTKITDRDVYFKDPTSTDSPQPLKNM